jgi:hypothetical protein
MSEARTAQLSPPLSDTAKSAFLRLSVSGRMLRSTVFEFSSTGPSSRQREKPA